MSQVSSSGTAVGYGLDGEGKISKRDREIFLYSTASSSGIHLASYPMGKEGSFPKSKVAGA
jgi:hypothetical protein